MGELERFGGILEDRQTVDEELHRGHADVVKGSRQHADGGALDDLLSVHRLKQHHGRRLIGKHHETHGLGGHAVAAGVRCHRGQGQGRGAQRYRNVRCVGLGRVGELQDPVPEELHRYDTHVVTGVDRDRDRGPFGHATSLSRRGNRHNRLVVGDDHEHNFVGKSLIPS